MNDDARMEAIKRALAKAQQLESGEKDQEDQ